MKDNQTMFRTNYDKRVAVGPASALLALACALALPATSAAQNALQGTGFALQINEKEMMLAHPGDPAMANYATWDTGFQRTLDRNMPFLMLTNLDTSEAPITEMELTIGDIRFNFGNTAQMFHGEYTMVGRSNPDAIVTSHVEDGGDKLVVNFGPDGLAAGDSVCFRINLDVDADHPNFFAYPDYRTVLFDMNGVQAYGKSVDSDDPLADNAKAQVTFGSGESAFHAGPVAFEDSTVGAPESLFSNRALRPYGIMENASTFEVSAEVTTEEVPEPSAIVLGLVGCLGGAVIAARKRMRNAAVRGNTV
jgi:hypothetical protein